MHCGVRVPAWNDYAAWNAENHDWALACVLLSSTLLLSPESLVVDTHPSALLSLSAHLHCTHTTHLLCIHHSPFPTRSSSAVFIHSPPHSHHGFIMLAVSPSLFLFSALFPAILALSLCHTDVLSLPMQISGQFQLTSRYFFVFACFCLLPLCLIPFSPYHLILLSSGSLSHGWRPNIELFSLTCHQNVNCFLFTCRDSPPSYSLSSLSALSLSVLSLFPLCTLSYSSIHSPLSSLSLFSPPGPSRSPISHSSIASCAIILENMQC